MIEVRNLRKTYGPFTAVDGITFEVPRGEIFGFIGPNGAGKTTTMRILSTLLEPTSGEARVNGLDVLEFPERVRQLIGYMPDYAGVYEGIDVVEYLDFFAAAYGVERSRRRAAIEGVMELTDLGGLRHKMAPSLSKGMRQRLILAKTLLHDPAVLILDEPAAGLDPRARIELRALLKELGTMGKTIIVSSHILTELADMCTSVGILEKGRIVAAGSIATILDRLHPGRTLALRTYEPEKALEVLARFATVQVLETADHTVRLNHTGEEPEIAEIVRALATAGVSVLGLSEEKANLEDLFLRITRGEVQ
ncbi:MAG: ABC transporter ATP-binding protein [Planctomycetes bacterium]|nr:ABC transporter ATP-binding protein [Planctomycetota bacterium]